MTVTYIFSKYKKEVTAYLDQSVFKVTFIREAEVERIHIKNENYAKSINKAELFSRSMFTYTI